MPEDETDTKRYTPGVKLQVVLEYIRNPKRKRRILKEKGITEEQLDAWHRELLDHAEQIIGEQQTPVTRPPVKPEPSELPQTVKSVAAAPPAEPETAPAASAWGIRLIRGWRESYHSLPSSRECPSWARVFPKGVGREAGSGGVGQREPKDRARQAQ